MHILTKKQIEFIENDIKQKGLNYEPLIQEMLDHISIDVENFITQGYSFKQAYNKISSHTSSGDLQKLEKQTFLLLNLKLIIMKKLLFLILGFIVLSLTFKLFHLNGYSRILDLSFIIICLAYIRIGIDFFKDKRKKILNPILGSLSFISVLFTIVPLLAWLLDEFTAFIEVNYNVFPSAILGFHIFGVVCLIKFISELLETETTLKKKETVILISVSSMFILLLPLAIANFYNYHIPFAMQLVKISALINVLIIIPYLVYSKLIKNRHIAILVLVGAFIGMNALPKRYLYSTSFSKSYQSEIVVKVDSNTEVNTIELKTRNEDIGGCFYKLEKDGNNVYKCKLFPNWRAGILEYDILVNDKKHLTDSLFLQEKDERLEISI